MSELELLEFENPNNEDLLNAIRYNASNDYQRRIPNADKASMDTVISNLYNYTPNMNEFLFQLINVIGLQIYKGAITWNNPLAKFKRGMLKNGDTIQEIMTGLLEAHRYNPNAEYLEKEIFGTERPDVQAIYHKITRRDYYKLTINEVELRQAFTSEFGLSDFITGLMAAPQTSDQWDEFLQTASLLKTWHDKGGYFNIQIPDIGAQGSTEAENKFALRRMRELADTLPFLSTRYNPAHMPMATTKEKLHLILTPEANAGMDVEALAGAFNVNYAEFNTRKTIIPAEYIGIDGFQAMVTTDDFFVLADTYFDVKTIVNPVGRTTNYFLHHDEILSVSMFEPAVLFTSTEESTPIIIAETPVQSVSAPILKDQGGDTVTDVIRGMSYQAISEAVTNPVDGANDAVKFVLVGAQSPRTKIWQTGFMTVAIDEAATSLTINVVSVDNDDVKATANFDVDGDLARLWPNGEVLSDADDDSLYEITPESVTITAAGNVRVPDQEGLSWTKTIGTGVTFTDTGDIVTIPHHGLNVGDKVKFGTITSTTGITAGTEYFVKTVPSADTITLSATAGGATLALTTNGTAANAVIPVADYSLQNIASGQTVTFNATAKTGYEIPVGATSSFPITRP